MRLDIYAFKSMRVCHCKTGIYNTYMLNYACLQSVSCYKYLGIHITSNLCWVTHTDYVAAFTT